MTTVNNQMLKFRIFRRRHRVSLIISVFISILFIFLFVNGLALSNAITTNESLVNDPHQSENILTYLIEKMAKFNIYKKKTVPFAKTDAASLSEFNNMMTTTSNQNLDKMLDETKLRLILESSKKIDPNENRLLAGHVFTNQFSRCSTRESQRLKSWIGISLTSVFRVVDIPLDQMMKYYLMRSTYQGFYNSTKRS